MKGSDGSVNQVFVLNVGRVLVEDAELRPFHICTTPFPHRDTSAPSL
jgi:hypothetical protein